MIKMYDTWKQDIIGAARQIKGQVELYKGSTLTQTYKPEDILSSIKIERTPINGKMFGGSYAQKLTVVLVTPSADVTIGDKIKPYIGTEKGKAPFQKFKITEVKKDEVKKNITLVGFDLMAAAADMLYKDLEIIFPTTLKEIGAAIAAKLGTTVNWVLNPSTFVNIQYTEDNKPNYSGKETIREVITDLAEASGTIAYIDNQDRLTFKQINIEEPVDTIEKNQYFSLTAGKPITLSSISSITELGDNVTAGTTSGFDQKLFSNGFIDNLTDIKTPLEQLALITKGITLYPYELKWRANPALELGDTIKLVLEDNTEITFPYYGETLDYSGGLKSVASWKEEEQKKVATNPTTVGEALNQTSAKVDKVNKKIELAVKDIEKNKQGIKDNSSSITQTAKDIRAEVGATTTDLTKKIEKNNQAILAIDYTGLETRVTQTERDITNNNDAQNKRIEAVETSVKQQVDNIQLNIDKINKTSTSEVKTSTGFTFNQDGLTINKTGSATSTTIDDNGMTIKRKSDNKEMLTAKDSGVDAVNLHATTYLIIGKNSRFEDMGSSTTGCFWIGG